MGPAQERPQLQLLVVAESCLAECLEEELRGRKLQQPQRQAQVAVSCLAECSVVILLPTASEATRWGELALPELVLPLNLVLVWPVV